MIPMRNLVFSFFPFGSEGRKMEEGRGFPLKILLTSNVEGLGNQ